MFHVFKHHDERVALYTHPVEGDDVFMLQVGEKLCLSVEVCSATLVGLFQSLKKSQDAKTREPWLMVIIYKNIDLVNRIY